ncbi:MAG: V-type ATP synthase subunit D [Erysipelotrichaceae bacterium]
MANLRPSPTKGNLIASKKSLELAKLGYDLMDRKRNVLIREMMNLVDKVKFLRENITETYQEAYLALQQANISLGVVNEIANAITIEEGINIVYRSVMGVEIPMVTMNETDVVLEYGFEESNSRLDEATIKYVLAKRLTVVLAEVDTSIYRLARAIQKTQKRANALKNIVIPNLEGDIKYISEALEEKEREGFIRLKVIKNQKQDSTN